MGIFGTKASRQALKSKIIGKSEDIALAPLLVFKPVMAAALERNKIPHENGLHSVVSAFYKHIILGAHYESNYEQNNLIDDVVNVVTEVIDYFKNLKKKKQEGTLSTDDLKTLTHAEKVAETPVQPSGMGSFMQGNSMLIVLAIVVVAAILMKKAS